MARDGGRVNLEYILPGHDNVAGRGVGGLAICFTYILIVSMPFPEYHKVIELLVMIQ